VSERADSGFAADGSRARLGRGFAGVTLAGLAGNALAYVLLLAAARVLPPGEYSELVTLLNLLLVAYVPTLALQVVTARRIATGQADGTLPATVVLAAVAVIVVVMLSPVAVAFLHLPNAVGPLLVAAALPGAALQGWSQGVWQGLERFRALAFTTLAGMVGRSAIGLVGLYAGRSAVAALLAVAIGTTVAGAISGHLAAPAAGQPRLGRHDRPNVSDLVTRIDRRGVLNALLECGHASHAYGVFLLLSATDLLLARHLLTTDLAATYAAGSVLTRIALWLPQSVASVLFASLTDHSRHRALFGRAVAVLAGLGAVEILGAWVLHDLATSIVGGDKYPALAHDIWIFAGIGACLAVLQFSLIAGLAVRSLAITILLWLTVISEAVAVLAGSGDSVRAIALVVLPITVVAAVAAVGLRLSLAAPATAPAQMRG